MQKARSKDKGPGDQEFHPYGMLVASLPARRVSRCVVDLLRAVHYDNAVLGLTDMAMLLCIWSRLVLSTSGSLMSRKLKLRKCATEQRPFFRADSSPGTAYDVGK